MELLSYGFVSVVLSAVSLVVDPAFAAEVGAVDDLSVVAQLLALTEQSAVLLAFGAVLAAVKLATANTVGLAAAVEELPAMIGAESVVVRLHIGVGRLAGRLARVDLVWQSTQSTTAFPLSPRVAMSSSFLPQRWSKHRQQGDDLTSRK